MNTMTTLAALLLLAATCLATPLGDAPMYKNFIQVNYTSVNTPCALLSFDSIYFAVDNSTATIDTIDNTTVISGGCSFSPSSSLYVLTGYITITQQQTNAANVTTTVSVSLFFGQDALYRAAAPTAANLVNGTGNSYLVYGLVFLNNTKTQFDLGNEWSAANGNSFDCGEQLNYTNAAMDMLNVTNVEWQGMLLDQAVGFGPADGNAVCPGASTDEHSRNNVGLIVGGIIAGFAALGILAFVYSKCKPGARDTYSPIA